MKKLKQSKKMPHYPREPTKYPNHIANHARISYHKGKPATSYQHSKKHNRNEFDKESFWRL